LGLPKNPRDSFCDRRNISDVTGRESLEFPSLAPDESELSPAGSLGNIKSSMGRENDYMTKQDILNLISENKWMMDVLRTAEKLDLPDWVIGAGFVRNKVWDYLHGYNKPKVDTADIDLVYYDPNGNDEDADEKLSKELEIKTGLNWEVVNEAYAHKWYTIKPPPYTSSEDAVSKWPETATCIGVRTENGKLKLMAPHGIEDLVNLIIRPSPAFIDKANVKNVVIERMEKKKWLEKWPKLKIVPGDSE